MAVGRGIFGAEEAGVVQGLSRGYIFDATLPHQGQEFTLVPFPVSVMFLEAVKDFLAWGERGYVDVVHAADLTKEKRKVVLLGKPRELRDVVEPDVDYSLGARLTKEFEKSGGGNLGESYSEDFQTVWSRLTSLNDSTPSPQARLPWPGG